MALTATELRSLLKEALHKDSTYTDPGDLNTFLTLGQERIVRESPHTLGAKATTLATVASTQEYNLASDFFQMRSIWLASTSDQLIALGHDRWVSSVESLATIPTGSPQWYCIFGWDSTNALWDIRLNPTPDAIYTIKYFYYWIPTAITGTATPAICSIGFSELLLEAAIMIARARNDPEGRVESTQMYRVLMQDYKAFSAQGPDYKPHLASHMVEGQRGHTVTLPPEFPAV